MEQVKVSPLQEALEVVERLPLEDQVTLIEVVERRLVESRRDEIARNAAATLQAVREGRASFGAIKDLQRDLSTKP